MRDDRFYEEFAKEWIDAWNSHDKGKGKRYAEYFVFGDNGLVIESHAHGE